MKKNRKQLRSFGRDTFPELAERTLAILRNHNQYLADLYALYLANSSITIRAVHAAIGGRYSTIATAREWLAQAGLIEIHLAANRWDTVRVLPPTGSYLWAAAIEEHRLNHGALPTAYEWDESVDGRGLGPVDEYTLDRGAILGYTTRRRKEINAEDERLQRRSHVLRGRRLDFSKNRAGHKSRKTQKSQKIAQDMDVQKMSCANCGADAYKPLNCNELGSQNAKRSGVGTEKTGDSPTTFERVGLRDTQLNELEKGIGISTRTPGEEGMSHFQPSPDPNSSVQGKTTQEEDQVEYHQSVQHLQVTPFPSVLSSFHPAQLPVAYRVAWMVQTFPGARPRIPASLGYGVLPAGPLWQAMAEWAATTPYWHQAWAGILWEAKQGRIRPTAHRCTPAPAWVRRKYGYQPNAPHGCHCVIPRLKAIFTGDMPLAGLFAGVDIHDQASLWAKTSYQWDSPIQVDMDVDAPAPWLTDDERWLVDHLPTLGVIAITHPVSAKARQWMRSAMPNLIADTKELGDDWRKVMLEYIAPQIRQMAGHRDWKGNEKWEPSLQWFLEFGWPNAIVGDYAMFAGAHAS